MQILQLLVVGGALVLFAQWCLTKSYAAADATFVQPFDDLKLISNVIKTSDTFLFPARNGKRSAELKRGFADIFIAAGIGCARAHDLRRSFASRAADLGYSDATIGELLGHSRRGVTAKHYIRRPDAALAAAADIVSTQILKMMDQVETQGAANCIQQEAA